jgi:hypothetical protein
MGTRRWPRQARLQSAVCTSFRGALGRMMYGISQDLRVFAADTATIRLKVGSRAVFGRSLALRPRLATGLP